MSSSERLICRVAVAFACAGISMALQTTASADTGPWSAPTKLSDDRIGGWFPDIAADDRGNVHVVWAADAMDNRRWADRVGAVGPEPDAANPQELPPEVMAALYYSRWNGQSWTTPNDIGLAPPGSALRSSVAVDGSGRVHLIRLGLGALDSKAAGQDRLWYTSVEAARGESVLSWSLPRQVTRSDRGYFSDIAVDSKGMLHRIWTESDKGIWGIYYARSGDGGVTWSTREALDGGNFVWWYRAQLTVDRQDRLHVVWEVTDMVHLGVTRGVIYATSGDGGKSWTRVTFPRDLPAYPQYGSRGPGPQQPSVGIDGDGKVLLVSRDPASNLILYQVSQDGRNWQEPTPLPEVTAGVPRPYDVYDMITDSLGHVHLVLVGYTTDSPSMSLVHLEWDGQGWTKPSVVTASPPYPEYPKLALSEGNRLHLVWFGGDRPSIDRSYVGIWYSTAQVNAPAEPARAGSVAPRGEAASPKELAGATSTSASRQAAQTGWSGAATVTSSSPQLNSGTGLPKASPVLIGALAAFLIVVVSVSARLGSSRLLGHQFTQSLLRWRSNS